MCGFREPKRCRRATLLIFYRITFPRKKKFAVKARGAGVRAVGDAGAQHSQSLIGVLLLNSSRHDRLGSLIICIARWTGSAMSNP